MQIDIPLTTHAAVAPPAGPRPRLRGWLHAAAAPLATLAGGALWWSEARTASDDRHLGLLVFGAALVGLYGISGLYHVGRWSARARYLWSRADVGMIVLFIAGSFTPIAVYTLEGRWRFWTLTIAWTVCGIGALIAASPIKGPRWLGSAAYLAVAWLAIVPFAKIVTNIPWQAVVLIGIEAVLYSVGAVVYARRRPDPWPHIFGFHELFHAMVIIGTAAHITALWLYLV